MINSMQPEELLIAEGLVKDIIDIDTECPMYDLWAVGMPPPGNDFIREAELRSGETAPPEVLKGLAPKDTTKTFFIRWLESLYRVALYKHGATFRFSIKGQPMPKLTPTAVGHIWGKLSDPPNPQGPQPARVLIIGKYPGWEDLANGRNFSGPTSQELIKALAELNVPESEFSTWYITNIVKHPNIDPMNTQKLPVTWVRNCMTLVQQELRLVCPDFILCLGDDAAKALLGSKNNVKTTSGQVLELTFPRHEFATETPIFHTAKVMTCMHPARAARQPDLFPSFCNQLKQFINLINGLSVGQKETDLDFYEIYDEETLSALVEVLIAEQAYEFALDCEWQGSRPADKGSYLRTIQFSWHNKKAACIVVHDENGKPFQGSWLPHLQKLLKNSDTRKVRIIGHNFRADLPWMLNEGLDLRLEFETPEDDKDPNGVTKLYGWQKTKTEGGFDTILAVHAWQETHPLGLEACSSQLLGVYRYDLELEDWKTEYCKTLGIAKQDIGGYGKCPDKILHPYGLYDALVTFRLYELMNNGPSARLDKDKFNNNCRMPFWIAMRASPAFLEMEMTGISLNKARAEEMIELYSRVRTLRLQELRSLLNWPDFNPNSSYHKVEMLFGEQRNSKKNYQRLRPPNALSLNLTPIKSTGKRSLVWKEIERREQEAQRNNQPVNSVISRYSPSTDKEILGILASDQDAKFEPVRKVRDLSFIGQLLKTVLRPAKTKVVVTPIIPTTPMEALAKLGEPQEEQLEEIDDLDENGDKIYERGLLSYLNDDNRVRTYLLPTTETGRTRSYSPNLMNISKKREPDYERICGKEYKYALRSVFKATPGHILIEADYVAAELAGIAWLSQDPNLIEHIRRSTLDTKDPDFFDVHSNLAVKAFRLDCAPNKKALEAAGKIALRTGAKSALYGVCYCMGAEALVRRLKEEGVFVTIQEAQALIDGVFREYPGLINFQKDAKSRVKDPGWLKNAFGRYRRFSPSTDRQVIAENERQSCNFQLQALVADCMSTALYNLMCYKKEHKMEFKLLLQIHDAVLLQAPLSELDHIYDVVLQKCLSTDVPIFPTYSSGARKLNIGPYYFGISKEVFISWGDKIPGQANKLLDIPSRFCDFSISDEETSVLLNGII